MHVYGHHDYNKHSFVPIAMEALIHNKPHKCQIYAKHCKKAFVLSMSTEHYRCWKFWSMATRATQILDAVFFKHKYLTNPSVTPKDFVIAIAKNLAQALVTSIPQHLQVFTIQALKDLSDMFMDASHKYSNDPAIHMPDAPPLHPHWKPRKSLRMLPTPLGSPPPRMHTTTISLTAPGTLPTSAPSSIQKSLFPPDVSSVGLWQNIAKQ